MIMYAFRVRCIKTLAVHDYTTHVLTREENGLNRES